MDDCLENYKSNEATSSAKRSVCGIELALRKFAKGSCEREALHRSSGLRRISSLTQSISFTFTLSQLKFIVPDEKNRLHAAMHFQSEVIIDISKWRFIAK